MNMIDKTILLSNLFNDNDYEVNKLVEQLKRLNMKEREFLIFKLFYNGINRNTCEKLKKIIRNYPFMFRNFSRVVDEALDARKNGLYDSLNRNENCYEIMEEYMSLLEKMSYLAKELNLNNSLELSVLFSYLLWNGYLSKRKVHKFQSENRKMIAGLLFADITDGIGVCLNYSEMLKDFLKYCGYQSIILLNHFDNNTKIDYIMNIGRIKSDDSQSKERNFNVKKADHTFNLIEENNKLYIYDSTNLLLYNINDWNSASLINGRGKNKLFPYASYSFCYSKDDRDLIDKLFIGEKLIPPYTKEDFISISEVNLEIIKNSTFLLEDFYVEARPYIVGVSEETNKIMKYIKTVR